MEKIQHLVNLIADTQSMAIGMWPRNRYLVGFQQAEELAEDKPCRGAKRRGVKTNACWLTSSQMRLQHSECFETVDRRRQKSKEGKTSKEELAYTNAILTAERVTFLLASWNQEWDEELVPDLCVTVLCSGRIRLKPQHVCVSEATQQSISFSHVFYVSIFETFSSSSHTRVHTGVQ